MIKSLLVSLLAGFTLTAPATAQEVPTPVVQRYRSIELHKLEYAIVKMMITDNLVTGGIGPTDLRSLTTLTNVGDVSDFSASLNATLKSLANIIEELGETPNFQKKMQLSSTMKPLMMLIPY